VQEIAPGLWHWTGRHEHTHSRVSSYYLEAEGVAIDAITPREGLDWFEGHGAPQHVVLTNRHHDRHAWRLREAFGCVVHCISNGAYELKGRGPVEQFEFGDELPGGVVMHEVGAICPDEGALHIPAHGALACADGVVRGSNGGPLRFVSESLMDEPSVTKQGLRDAYRRLLELDFDLLLLAHGDPVLGDAKRELREFIDQAA
jgi:hypothetical protein